MEYSDVKFKKKRESRKRALTACETCRLRKTRCDNTRPFCSYCINQRVRCVYPDTLPLFTKSESTDIRQQLDHITNLLEDLKYEKGPDVPLISSFRGTLSGSTGDTLNLTTRITDSFSGDPVRNTTSVDHVQDSHHDPRILFTACSPEILIRWRVFRNVISEGDRHIQSFILDSIGQQPRWPTNLPPKRTNPSLSVANLQHMCEKYVMVPHRFHPVIDMDELRLYAHEVTVQGLGWDGKSCLVLLACALACCSSPIVSLDDYPDFGNMPELPPSEVDMEQADFYFEAAMQRMGFLSTSPIDIQCFILAGMFHRYTSHALDAWFCFQQASCRLDIRLRSLRREEWVADGNYHNLEARLYWSCMHNEHELQRIMPLWNSSLDALPYSDPFPSLPRSAGSSPGTVQDNNSTSTLDPYISEADKTWKTFLGGISCSRATETMLIDLWRCGPEDWLYHPKNLLDRTRDAVRIIDQWWQVSCQSLSMSNDHQTMLRIRYYAALEKVLRPTVYLAFHYHTLPICIKTSRHLTNEIFDFAQRGIETCERVIATGWHNVPNPWGWHLDLQMFAAAMLIIGAKLCDIQYPCSRTAPMVRPPPNWQSIVKTVLRLLALWEHQAAGLTLMRDMLHRIYSRTCEMAGTAY